MDISEETDGVDEGEEAGEDENDVVEGEEGEAEGGEEAEEGEAGEEGEEGNEEQGNEGEEEGGQEEDNSEAAPPELTFSDMVFDLKFHPTQDLLAACDINGRVYLYHNPLYCCHISMFFPLHHLGRYKYSLDNNELVFGNKIHKKSCRAISFSQDGNCKLLVVYTIRDIL